MRLQFRTGAVQHNSGIFVRSRDLHRPVCEPTDPTRLIPCANQHWVAVNAGFEIQIDETAAPDGQGQRRTGAVYGVASTRWPVVPARRSTGPRTVERLRDRGSRRHVHRVPEQHPDLLVHQHRRLTQEAGHCRPSLGLPRTAGSDPEGRLPEHPDQGALSTVGAAARETGLGTRLERTLARRAEPVGIHADRRETEGQAHREEPPAALFRRAAITA
ncbi:hypothetical protein [Streptomyces sp. NPDC056817]|uniref:hypothetical protein n=1 Tax=Streptomyces sp. NPDC056817 TaxID=3345950 RepID=UPI0036AB5727